MFFVLELDNLIGSCHVDWMIHSKLPYNSHNHLGPLSDRPTGDARGGHRVLYTTAGDWSKAAVDSFNTATNMSNMLSCSSLRLGAAFCLLIASASALSLGNS